MTKEQKEKANKIKDVLSRERFNQFYRGDFENWITGEPETPEEREKLEEKVLEEIVILFNL